MRSIISVIFICFINIFTGCDAALVSDISSYKIDGIVYNEYGRPFKKQKVKLFKIESNLCQETLSLFSLPDIYSVFDYSKYEYRNTYTDDFGRYKFILSTNEIEPNSYLKSILFAVSTSSNEINKEIILSNNFIINDKLDNNYIELPKMKHWNFNESNIQVLIDNIKIQWEPSSPIPKNNKYLVVFNDGTWIFEVDANELIVPIKYLGVPSIQNNLDSNNIIDNEPEEIRHNVQIITITDTLKLRTPLVSFLAVSHKQKPLEYKKEESNISGYTCTGKNLLKLNDNIFSKTEGIEDFRGYSDILDTQCIIIDLNGTVELNEILIHNSFIRNPGNSKISMSYTDDDNWQHPDIIWETLNANLNILDLFPYFYGHIKGLSQKVTYIKIELLDNNNARFDYIGEISVYGKRINFMNN